MQKFSKFGLIALPLGIVILLGFFKIAFAQTADTAIRRPDTLPTQLWWRIKVQAQANASRNQQYPACLFGDSISSALGNTIGDGVANFAMGGLSTVSLVEQLKFLQEAQVKCQTAVIAIGTNDAMYSTSNQTFVQNLSQSIELVRTLGATQIILLPAFYSTIPASYDPSMAGPIERVDEINGLMQQVAASYGVPVMAQEIQPLFAAHSLRTDLTFDGVHLNDAGKAIYRQIVQHILQQTISNRG